MRGKDLLLTINNELKSQEKRYELRTNLPYHFTGFQKEAGVCIIEIEKDYTGEAAGETCNPAGLPAFL